MSRNIIDQIVREHQGMAFDFQQDGLCVLDGAGVRMLHLPIREVEEAGPIGLVEKLTTFFLSSSDDSGGKTDLEGSRGSENANGTTTSCDCHAALQQDQSSHDKRLSITFSIDIPIEVLTNNRLLNALKKLCHSLSQEHLVRIIIWFRQQPASWGATLSPFISAFHQDKSVVWMLAGPFAEMPEEEKEFLSSHNVSLLFGRVPANLSPADAEILQELATFGFRVPVLWFVTKRNIQAIREQIDSWMEMNYYSGFALPLISHYPFVSKEDVKDLLPSARDYISLLVDIYRLYPDYDEVMFPLSSFANRSYYGNWSESLSVPRHLQFYADSQDGLSLYPQTSLHRTHWAMWDQLAAMDTDEIVDDIFSFYRESVAPHLRSTCKSCSWKNLCGGEAGDGAADEAIESSLVCEVTRFFLHSFLWQRVKALEAAKAIAVKGADGDEKLMIRDKTEASADAAVSAEQV